MGITQDAGQTNTDSILMLQVQKQEQILEKLLQKHIYTHDLLSYILSYMIIDYMIIVLHDYVTNLRCCHSKPMTPVPSISRYCSWHANVTVVLLTFSTAK